MLYQDYNRFTEDMQERGGDGENSHFRPKLSHNRAQEPH